MKPDFFWKHWPKAYKSLYQFLLIIFSASILVYALTYIWGSGYVIHWEITNIIQPVKTLFSTYYMGLFQFPIHVDNFVIMQNFSASDLQIHTWPAYALMVWLAIFISIILAFITDLQRFWFLVSAIFFTLLLIGLKLDYLVLFNQYNQVALVVAFVLYFPPLYVFHFIKKNTGIGLRLLVFFCATAIFAFIIYKFSEVNLPFFHLANYGIYVPLLLTILFIFMTGHEIVSAFLRVISSNTVFGENRSIFHFLFISIIFLANVALLLLKNTRTIDLGMYLIGAFLLLTTAAVIGIWGYRTREVTYQGIYPFFPSGAFLYLLLAINAHITVAYFFISGNDFFVEVVEDAVVFSQLGYGALFVVYFLANFYDLLRQNINISNVLYKPRRMPYFTSRLAGLIAIMALFFRFNMTPYYQAVAGFYSGIGDLYFKMEDHAAAREYYNLSNNFSGTSHRANYALANMERKYGKAEEEIRYLKQAVKKNPTEFAYANLANKMKVLNQLFESLFLLHEGLEKFPQSGVLMNNLGLMYFDLENVDSAYYYLNEASHFRNARSMAETNVYALLRIKDLSIKKDTLDYLQKTTDYLPAVNNLVVLANDLGIVTSDKGKLLFGEVATTGLDQIVYNYNKTLNSPAAADSVYFSEMRVFYDSGNTSWFQDNLLKAGALAQYAQGNMTAAFNTLNRLAGLNPEGEYNSLLGKLSVSLGADRLAIDYFKNSFQSGHPEVATELAFAYMQTGEPDKAAFIWRQMMQGGDSAKAAIASRMVSVLNANSIRDILNADTESRYSFIAWRGRQFNPDQLEALAQSFENEDVRALAFLCIFDIYLELEQKDHAVRVLEKTAILNLNMEHVLEKINLAQCRFAYHFYDRELMERLRLNLKDGGPHVAAYLKLFENLLMEDKNVAVANLAAQAYVNPFFEAGVVEAVKYLNDVAGDKDKAYEILLNAVNINPFSLEISQAYALQCLRVGLKTYAMEAREELRQTMNSVSFRTFDQKFNEVLNESSTESSNW
jgi:tetratricopeptide (TPR) repeat protein